MQCVRKSCETESNACVSDPESECARIMKDEGDERSGPDSIVAKDQRKLMHALATCAEKSGCWDVTCPTRELGPPDELKSCDELMDEYELKKIDEKCPRECNNDCEATAQRYGEKCQTEDRPGCFAIMSRLTDEVLKLVEEACGADMIDAHETAERVSEISNRCCLG